MGCVKSSIPLSCLWLLKRPGAVEQPRPCPDHVHESGISRSITVFHFKRLGPNYSPIMAPLLSYRCVCQKYKASLYGLQRETRLLLTLPGLDRKPQIKYFSSEEFRGHPRFKLVGFQYQHSHSCALAIISTESSQDFLGFVLGEWPIQECC